MARTRYDGQVAIITGGASGIGRAIGEQMAQRGAHVVLADRQAAAAEEVAASLRGAGHQATAVELDVRDADAFDQVAKSVVETAGSIDFFFNNAGIGVGARMDEYERSDWDDVLDVNVRGVAYGIQAIYPRMVAQRSGHIINTASIAGLLPATNEGSYTMAKHAVVGVSRSLRIEAKPLGVKVSALCPGVIRTPILTGGEFGRLKWNVSKSKIMEIWEMMRPMDVDEFARQVLQAVARNEATIIVPKWWKALWLVDRIAPSLSEYLWTKMDEMTQVKLREAMSEAGDEEAERGNGATAHV